MWKIVSPLLDAEILSKTFFLPSNVDNVEKAIAWIDHKPGLVEPTLLPTQLKK